MCRTGWLDRSSGKTKVTDCNPVYECRIRQEADGAIATRTLGIGHSLLDIGYSRGRSTTAPLQAIDGTLISPALGPNVRLKQEGQKRMSLSYTQAFHMESPKPEEVLDPVARRRS